MSDKVDEKLKRREERYDRERRVRIKSSEDLETLEEVFDKRTLLTILKILNIGKLKEITGVLKAGKEVAVKIFLTSSNIFRQGRLKYIQGDPRFKDIPHDTRSLVDMWALKEYKNLELAGQAITVPAPIYVEKNVILLEFVGKDGESAPHLREVPLEAPTGWYKKTLEMLKDLHDKVK